MTLRLKFLSKVGARRYQLDTMTLAEFHISHQKKIPSSGALRARVEGFSGDLTVVERLKEMGLHEGLEIEVVGQAPFGGPMLFRFGNTVLALRVEEAQCALIQTL
jgi:ferrous iron transport protein A